MNWFLNHQGVQLHINPVSIPAFKEVVVDVETDGKDNVYCIGFCGDPKNVYVVFNPNKNVYDFLTKQSMIFHHWRADLSWLEKYGIKKEQVVYDTMLGEYVLNSTRKKYGLKHLCKEYFGFNWPEYDDLTEDKRYIEIACKSKPELYKRKIKHYKTKPDKVELKLPREITLLDLPQEIVANYNGWDVYATYMLYRSQLSKMDNTHKQFLNKIEHPTSIVLYESEKHGIQTNLQTLLKAHKFYRNLMKCYRRAWKHYAGDVLISSPSQVLKYLNFTGIAVANTNEDTLNAFKNIPIIKTLLNYRHSSKICSTYTKPLYKKTIASMDYRIHCNFKQHTDTGRLACADPNLQNQPKETRSAFEAKKDHMFINADWSQIELRIPAHYSNEPLMVDTFVHGKKKIHQVTADQIGRDYNIGKTVNFLLTNSGGGYRLAEVANISVDEAFDVFRKFHEKFHTYYEWTKQEKALAYNNKGVRTLFGRFVPLPQIRAPEEKVRARYERKAISIKVQGSAADLMKVAMIKIYKKHGLVPVISLHDELMYEVHLKDVDRVKQIIKQEMETVAKLKVPLVADVGVGKTWAEAKAK